MSNSDELFKMAGDVREAKRGLESAAKMIKAGTTYPTFSLDEVLVESAAKMDAVIAYLTERYQEAGLQEAPDAP